MLQGIWKLKVQGADALTARLIVLNVAAVIALYVVVSMIAALARFPGQETDGKGGNAHRTAVTFPGPEEASEPWLQDFIPWSYHDLVAATQRGGASENPITTKPNINMRIAQVSEPRHHGIIGCTASTLPTRFKRSPQEFTR